MLAPTGAPYIITRLYSPTPKIAMFVGPLCFTLSASYALACEMDGGVGRPPRRPQSLFDSYLKNFTAKLDWLGVGHTAECRRHKGQCQEAPSLLVQYILKKYET